LKAKLFLERVYGNKLRNWRKIAQEYGISKAEQELSAPAFSKAG